MTNDLPHAAEVVHQRSRAGMTPPKMPYGDRAVLVTVLLLAALSGRTIMYRDRDAEASF
jgi:hypothetical protein